MPSFSSRVSHIQRDEPVSASVASRPDRALEQRTNYLLEVLSATEAGMALVLRDQALAAEALIGQPVYWNATAQQYEPALAATEQDAGTGALVPARSSDVVGLVLNKQTGARGDIVIWGVVKFDSMRNAIAETPQAGRYFLSSAAAGQLVRQRPAVSSSVCLLFGGLDDCDENTWVFVMPQLRDFLEDHVHLQFKLTAKPAGTHVPPAAGVAHTITDPDVTLPGWLPAGHAVFAGRAPAGAYFGYNLAAHPELQQAWPPIPASAAVLEMLKPDDSDRRGGRVPGARVQFDQYGIWWMSSCYDEVPWPTALDTTASSSSSAASASSLSSAAQTCPPTETMELWLSFIKMTFATDKTVVTSLRPDAGEPLEFVNCDGVAAVTGDLLARLNLALLINTPEALGGQALKGVTDGKFDRGWLAEGLVAGSDAVTLASTHSRRLTPGAAAGAGNPLVHQGIVTVDVQLDPTERELLPQIVVLGDAVERVYKNIPYIGFPNGRDSGVRLKFLTPTAGLPTNPKIKIRATIFGRAAGTLTDLNTTYYRLTRPTTGSPTALTEGDTALTMATNITVLADNAYEVESAEITIAAGDTLYVSLDRAAAGAPTYDAEIGLIRVAAVLVAGS